MGMIWALCALAAAGADPPAATPAPAQTTSPTGVQEVVVAGSRPIAQTLIDRRVYAVGTDLQATTGTAADLLANIPSVEVDADGNVTLRGDANVTILIDGKPAAAFQGSMRGFSLQSLSAGQIDRIEVLTNPPAQYKAEGSGGVINIVLKKPRAPGLTGGAQLSVGDQGRVVGSVGIAYNRGPLKASAAFGVRQESRERISGDDRVVTDPTLGPPTASRETIDEHFHRFTPFGKIDLGYAFNDRQSLSASASHRDLTGHRFFDQFDYSAPVGDPWSSITDRHSDGHEWNAQGEESVRFDQKFSHPGELLSLTFNRSTEHERERYNYIDTYLLPVQSPTFDDLHLSHDLIKSEFGLDYAMPFDDEHGVEAGLDVEDDDDKFDDRGDTIDPVTGQPTVDPDLTYDYRFHQSVYAAYAEAHTALGPWRVQTGVRYELTQARGALLDGNVISQRRYDGVYPSLNLERDLDYTSRLLFSVSRRLNRPDPEILNPFVDHQDTHNLRAGNPNLLPEDITGAELGWTQSVAGASTGVTGYYRIYRDSITNIVTPVGPDVVLSTVANLPKRRDAGLELTRTAKLTPTLSFNLSANAFWEQIDAESLGAPGLKSTFGVNGKARLDWRPTCVDLGQITLSRSDRRLTPQGYVGAIDIVNTGFSHRFTNALTMVATVSDALDGQRLRRVTISPDLEDVYLRHQLGRVAYVGFTWTFSGKPKDPGFDYEP